MIGGLAVEAIATPVYRQDFYSENGKIRGSWFDIAETTLSLVPLTEFLIKLVADGFDFTPNAYIRSIWNALGLIMLIVNVTTGLIFIGGLSRFTRSLGALRALRLIALIEKMCSTLFSR